MNLLLAAVMLIVGIAGVAYVVFALTFAFPDDRHEWARDVS